METGVKEGYPVALMEDLSTVVPAATKLVASTVDVQKVHTSPSDLEAQAAGYPS